MDKEIKKKIASNWFKTLQNIICFEIEKLSVKNGKKIQKRKKVEVNIEFSKMERYLKKLE